jgi:hypothetical protein
VVFAWHEFFIILSENTGGVKLEYFRNSFNTFYPGYGGASY